MDTTLSHRVDPFSVPLNRELLSEGREHSLYSCVSCHDYSYPESHDSLSQRCNSMKVERHKSSSTHEPGWDMSFNYASDAVSYGFRPSMNGDVERPTVESLGWTHIEAVWEKYDFVKGSNFNDAHFELKDTFTANESTPPKVFLEEKSLLTGTPGPFICKYPVILRSRVKKPKFSCEIQFKRPADLDRHYQQNHVNPLKDVMLMCDRKNCSRGVNRPFSRKDHFRDHLRDYHLEDIGKAKQMLNTSEQEQKEIQREWLQQRQIDHKKWRCSKCLTNVRVKGSDWQCSNLKCRMPCEEERRVARELLQRAEDQSKMSEAGTCNTCFNSGIRLDSVTYFDYATDPDGVADVACPDCEKGNSFSGTSEYSHDEIYAEDFQDETK